MSKVQLRGPRLLAAKLPGNPYRGNWRNRLGVPKAPGSVKTADSILDSITESRGLNVAGGPALFRDYHAGKEAIAGISAKTKAKMLTYGGLGAAGAATAYGAFKGWQSGQAELNNSLKQGFNPQSVF